MTRLKYGWLALLSLAALLVTSFAPVFLSVPEQAEASSHREAPLISQDPVADATDLYAFISPDRRDSVTFITNWIPYQSPSGGPNWFRFGDDVLYELHIDNVGDAQDHIAFQFRFKTEIVNPNTFQITTDPVTSLNDKDLNLRQFMDITRLDAPAGSNSCKNTPLANCAAATKTVLGTHIPVAPPNVGPASFPIYAGVAALAVTDLGKGIKAFAGPRADSFFADIGSLFDLTTIREVPGNQGGGVNNFASYNVSTISLQIPIDQLTKNNTRPTDPKSDAAVIGSWLTSSRRTTGVLTRGVGSSVSGNWVQIERLGMPLVNEIVVPLALKDAFNGLYPWEDATIPAVVNVVLNPEPARLIKQRYNIDSPPTPRSDVLMVFAQGVAGLNQLPNVVPSEMLRLNVAIPPSKKPKRLGVLAGDVGGFPNGRRLNDDVVDIELQVVAGVLVNGFNIAPNNQLGDGVNRPFRPVMDVFPYQATPYSGFYYYPARSVPRYDDSDSENQSESND